MGAARPITSPAEVDDASQRPRYSTPLGGFGAALCLLQRALNAHSSPETVMRLRTHLRIGRPCDRGTRRAGSHLWL